MNVIEELQNVLKLEAQAISTCAQALTQPATRKTLEGTLDCLKKTLDQGGKIVVTGVGKSGKIAQKIAATLSSTGSLAVYLHPTEGLHGDLGLVMPGDAVLALSYSGNTEELLRLLPSLKSRKITIIGMGGNAESKLASSCDFWINGHVEQEACPHNLAPTTSTTLALALGDAIAVTLMKLRGFNLESFARNHPGGSIGNQLTLTVADLMLGHDKVATLPQTASVDEVVIASTEKKLGAVLIVEGKKLLGIVTDGDIRRALKHREKFFSLKASDIMTKTPITASPEMLARDALRLMEDRPGQIKELPVIDAHGHWVGLIRLHDIARTF